MKHKKDIIEIVEDICELLILPQIKIKKNKDKDLLAYLHGDTIYVSDIDDLKLLTFTICHELRHFWQLYYHKDIYFKDGYIERDKTNLKDYNAQLSEIDANAFANAMLIFYYDSKINLKHLGDDIDRRIQIRTRQIILEELKDKLIEDFSYLN